MERIRVIVTCYQSKQKIEKLIFRIEIISRKNQYGENQGGSNVLSKQVKIREIDFSHKNYMQKINMGRVRVVHN